MKNEQIVATLELNMNKEIAYNGENLHRKLAKSPVRAPYIFDGRIIIPFEIPSGAGYVSSTAKARLVPTIGTITKPINDKFIPNIKVYYVGREIYMKR